MFHIIQQSSIILKSRGVYKQTECYAYNGQVFAKNGAGFIKLFKHQNGTSIPSVSWESASLPFDIKFGETGVMIVPNNVVNIAA
jgi:hypothetical protein